MLKVVRSKKSRTASSRYSIMACDGCGAECAESKQLGQTGPKGRDAAHAAAKATPGWTEVWIPAPPRVWRYRQTLELLCPKCSAPASVQVTDDDGEAD